MSRATRVSEKIGLPPGSLVYVGKKKEEPIRITSISYEKDTLQETTFEAVQDCLYFKERPPVTWVNIDGVHDVRILETIGSYVGLHPLVMEDIVNTHQRPKLEDHDDYILIITKMWFWDGDHFDIYSEQVSLILGPSYVITFQEKPGDIFDPVRQRIRSGGPRFRGGGSDYLAYALLDTIVDNYFVILEKLDERIETLEELALSTPARETLEEVHLLRRELILLARSIWPHREVIGRLERDDFPLIQTSTRLYLRDVYDHTIQVIEAIETFRDRVSGVRDIYLSMLSNNMNVIMKFLTIIGTIFIPLTFIAGVYGMNFKNMPELEWRWGYPFSLSVMGLTAIGMLVYFWRKKWF